MEGFLTAFSLLNNLFWKSFNISIKKTFSFAQRTLLNLNFIVFSKIIQPLKLVTKEVSWPLKEPP